MNLNIMVVLFNFSFFLNTQRSFPMKHMKSTWAAMGAALVLAACGGGNGTQTSKVSFNSMVNFGDSLSDVGTYKVGTVAALKGGQYTINSDTNQNWTALMAKQLALAEPCPAQTG
ncbi:MAG: hypothetical protein ORN29_05235, partial [Rhodoferax sp.]|nr:hypothetical protein [Rhodoferax sp.]